MLLSSCALILASALALADEPAPAAAAPEKTTLQIVQFSPSEYTRTGIAWQVIGADGHALTTPELASLLGDHTVATALRRDQQTSGVEVVGFALGGAYLLTASAIALNDGQSLVPYAREDRSLTGAFLASGGIFSLTTAVLIGRAAHDRRAHPALWWGEDEVQLQIASASRSAP